MHTKLKNAIPITRLSPRMRLCAVSPFGECKRCSSIPRVVPLRNVCICLLVDELTSGLAHIRRQHCLSAPTPGWKRAQTTRIASLYSEHARARLDVILQLQPLATAGLAEILVSLSVCAPLVGAFESSRCVQRRALLRHDLVPSARNASKNSVREKRGRCAVIRDPCQFHVSVRVLPPPQAGIVTRLNSRCSVVAAHSTDFGAVDPNGEGGLGKNRGGVNESLFGCGDAYDDLHCISVNMAPPLLSRFDVVAVLGSAPSVIEPTVDFILDQV